MTVTVTYLKKITIPEQFAGSPGDVRELDALEAERLSDEGYVKAGKAVSDGTDAGTSPAG